MISEMNDKQMYAQARDEVEPEFCKLLERIGMTDVRQGTKIDDVHHIDVFAKGAGGQQVYFDVKDQTSQYAGKSKNYNIDERIVAEVKNDIKEKYAQHFIACRLYSADGRPTGKYVCFRTKDIVKNGLIKRFKRKKDGKPFCLFNIDEAMKALKEGKSWKTIG